MLSRRFFIKSLSFSGLVLLLPPFFHNCSRDSVQRWRVFTNMEAKTVEALAEQIIPADEYAGAKEAGVVNFIDKQLNGPYARYIDNYKNGIEAINITAQKKHNLLFEELNFKNQYTLMLEMENGTLSGEEWQHISTTHFFRLIRDHSLQGYYGSPRHGGNKDYVSYRMIGLDYPHIIGRNKYLT